MIPFKNLHKNKNEKMKKHLNKKIKSEIALSAVALFSISNFLLIQNGVKQVQNVAYATEISAETKCTDSDNGLDYFTKGKVYSTDSTGTFQSYDKCSETTEGQLIEYKCLNNAWYATNYQCPNGCKDGVCVTTEDDTEEEGTTMKCTDSDNGTNYFTKGTVVFDPFGSGNTDFKKTDECSTTITGQLTEYKCVDNVWSGVNYQCPNGCKDGACIKETAMSSYSLPDNTIIKLPGDQKFYTLQGGKKIAISSIYDLTKYGYTIDEIQRALKAYGSSIPLMNPNNRPEIIKDSTGKVYRIVNGKKVWVPTIAAFNAQGLKWEEVSSQISDSSSYTESKLVKDSEGNIYFITSNGKKKLIINTEVFNSYGNKTEDIVEVSDEFLDSIETVKLVREKNSNKVYLLTGQTKQWIKNIQAFKKLGLKWEDIDTVNSTEINAYPEGTAIE